MWSPTALSDTQRGEGCCVPGSVLSTSHGTMEIGCHMSAHMTLSEASTDPALEVGEICWLVTKQLTTPVVFSLTDSRAVLFVLREGVPS
jgi:hypothetical protein